jgi:hypothetical protein
MGRLAFISRILRPRRPRTVADKAHDRRADARTHRMVNGKGMDAIGRSTDFESDSERPRY